MHEIASQERKIMLKQQKQIQKIQLSTRDIIGQLQKKRGPVLEQKLCGKLYSSYDVINRFLGIYLAAYTK